MQRPGPLVPLGRDPRRSKGAASEPGAWTGVPKGTAAAGHWEGQKTVSGKPRDRGVTQGRDYSAESPAHVPFVFHPGILKLGFYLDLREGQLPGQPLLL